MKSKNYIIADMMYNVNYSQSFTDSEDSPFLYDNCCQIDMSTIKINLELDASIGIQQMKINPSGIDGIKTQIGYIIYIFNNKGNIVHLIQIDNEICNITVKSSSPQKQPFEGSVGEVIFRTSILFQKGIVVHASAIEYEGKGIIFSAPSGTGKSTHANLWVEHKSAIILNGDRPALRIINDEVNVYGTPWSGTSHQYVNKKAPLKAIVLLEQSPINEIEKLSSEQAVRLLVARCYLPYFDEQLMSLALDNIGCIIKKIPVYLLKCRPDIEAVEIVFKCLQ